MNENTAKLIEQLAKQLGTTSEYLWGVLLKQAYVSATMSLFVVLAAILLGFALWKIHKWMLKKDVGVSGYDRYDMAPMFLIIGVFCLGALLTLSVNNIVIGYFNPEYWAFQKILDSVRNR